MARSRVSIPEMWEPPPDVIHLLDLQADHRLKWLATTRAERQQAIQAMATARGTLNDSGYLMDVVNAVGEVFKEAAAGFKSLTIWVSLPTCTPASKNSMRFKR